YSGKTEVFNPYSIEYKNKTNNMGIKFGLDYSNEIVFKSILNDEAPILLYTEQVGDVITMLVAKGIEGDLECIEYNLVSKISKTRKLNTKLEKSIYIINKGKVYKIDIDIESELVGDIQYSII